MFSPSGLRGRRAVQLNISSPKCFPPPNVFLPQIFSSPYDFLQPNLSSPKCFPPPLEASGPIKFFLPKCFPSPNVFLPHMISSNQIFPPPNVFHQLNFPPPNVFHQLNFPPPNVFHQLNFPPPNVFILKCFHHQMFSFPQMFSSPNVFLPKCFPPPNVFLPQMFSSPKCFPLRPPRPPREAGCPIKSFVLKRFPPTQGENFSWKKTFGGRKNLIGQPASLGGRRENIW